MVTLTIHLPEEKHSQLKNLARARGVTVNQLMEELSTVAVSEFEAMTRFNALAATGNVERGLEILEKLDRASAL
ncbi:toxin-antitoxin system HicB family antitoxin [Oscillatoria sp. FACHB-1406]|uniref:toxin-antitoxin system HicB family antitoxin n=1 Tax=Oscillatoria sp. FACHB-1406 TaxID=2692846 RepID=UPI001688E932|nr:toxin-antitoxin system HicB family antitoxin [Oscillatoria sp. FACHB-1406]MBD2576543.1 toxin-antitoxin system HicB family antitoxin [Oscillatoria sp. FACHB-1406]